MKYERFLDLIIYSQQDSEKNYSFLRKLEEYVWALFHNPVDVLGLDPMALNAALRVSDLLERNRKQFGFAAKQGFYPRRMIFELYWSRHGDLAPMLPVNSGRVEVISDMTQKRFWVAYISYTQDEQVCQVVKYDELDVGRATVAITNFLMTGLYPLTVDVKGLGKLPGSH